MPLEPAAYSRPGTPSSHRKLSNEPAAAVPAPLVTSPLIAKLILPRDVLKDEAANTVPVFTEPAANALAALEDAEMLRAGTGSAPRVRERRCAPWRSARRASARPRNGLLPCALASGAA